MSDGQATALGLLLGAGLGMVGLALGAPRLFNWLARRNGS